VPGLGGLLGPIDPLQEGEHRLDGHLPDGYGSPYWLLAQVLPGFHTFRYPAKLLTFSCVALAALAALGWDALAAGATRRVRRALVAIGAILLVGLAASIALAGPVVAGWKRMESVRRGHSFGPFLPEAALADTRWSFGFGLAMLAASALLLLRLRPHRPALAALAAVGLVALDLGIANSGMVLTVPQALFEAPPEVLKVIAEAEEADPADQPYRVHRMSLWEPAAWLTTRSEDRVADFVRWERNTIQPKYAIPLGTSYTVTEGTAELYDFWFFFAPFWGNPGSALREVLRMPPDQKLLYYPRRGFDLWNSRYFVLPVVPTNDERRATFSFVPNTRMVYPTEGTFAGPDGKALRARWGERDDWQVLRNERAMPRAWVVHELRVMAPVVGMRRAEREAIMEEILYQADDFWYNPSRVLHDPRRIAWVETLAPQELARFRPGGPAGARERVTFAKYAPDEVVMEVTLDRPGVVVLADVFYPGWELTIDGKSAEILRVNRLMRGAAVEGGPHRLVYRYRPRSVRVGAVLSLAGLVGLVGTLAWARGRRRG
jgi:hypothetical protein